MKTLIVILIIAVFLQTTIMPMNLTLIILICRAYTKISKSNLYLAFVFGLLVSLLNFTTLGFDSLLFIISVQLTESLSKTRLAGNSILIIPLSFILLAFSYLSNFMLVNQTWELFPKVVIESLIALPVLYIVRLWEERFIVRRDIKLRV